MTTRTSHHISRKAVTTLLHSARTAKALGRPMNVAVCIDLELLGIAPEKSSGAFCKMRRQKFGRWSSYKPKATGAPKNGAPVDTWVIEAPNDRYHVHWMLNVDPRNRTEFEVKLEKWVKEMAQIDCLEVLPAGALHITDVYNPEGLKLYMAKGIDPFYAPLFKINPVPGGVVIGRRAGTARALGPAVWKPLKRAYLAEKARTQRPIFAAKATNPEVLMGHPAGH